MKTQNTITNVKTEDKIGVVNLAEGGLLGKREPVNVVVNMTWKRADDIAAPVNKPKARKRGLINQADLIDL